LRLGGRPGLRLLESATAGETAVRRVLPASPYIIMIDEIDRSRCDPWMIRKANGVEERCI
jgi:hypothetical protein